MSKKICIIIGHGGRDCGAINPISKETELDYNRELAPILADLLKIKGYDVEIHNRGYNRVENIPYINGRNFDLILSLHCNSFNTVANGTEMLYWNTSKKSMLLAEELQKAITLALGTTDRKIKPKFMGDRGAYLLRKTNAPCVILEPFFIDNEKDWEIGKTMKNEYANAIVEGVEHYFKDLEVN